MSLDLAFAERGDGPPLLVTHGLFGSARNWATIADRLAATRRVFALDLRNHGASPWADAMTYAAMAGDMLHFLDAHGLAAAAVMGHSMGGKAAMLLALLHPERVERLVVVDIAPVPNPPTLLAYVRAMRDLDLAAIGRRSDADRALAGAIPNAAERAFLVQNLMPAEDGGLRWRLNLPAIERDFDAITGWPELPPGAAYDGPTLFVSGARSTYVRPEDHEPIRRLFPNAEFAEIPDAGHWVHAEQPQLFLEAVTPFLS